jgi:hypothetical protein
MRGRPVVAATRRSSNGVPRWPVRTGTSAPTGTAATDAEHGASGSSSSTTAGQNARASTPPSWLPTTATATRAPTNTIYQTFPTVLVVTTSDIAEARFAHQACLAQQRHGGAPLPVFLTTIDRVRANPEGALGSIWRAPGSDARAARQTRVHWLPGLPRAPIARPARPGEVASGKGHGDESLARLDGSVAVPGRQTRTTLRVGMLGNLGSDAGL